MKKILFVLMFVLFVSVIGCEKQETTDAPVAST